MSWKTIVVAALLVGFFSSWAPAQSKDAKKEQPKQPAASKSQGKRPPRARKQPTADDIKRVNEFIGVHLPELKNLLAALKQKEPSRYANAVRELTMAIERLDRLRQRDESAYKLALKSWQLDKRAQLLALRVRMEGSEDAEKQLRELLEKRFELEYQILKRTRDKQAARLQKLDESLQRFQDSRASAIERQIRDMTRSKSRKPATRPVSK